MKGITLTDAEFWQARGLIDAHGYSGAAEKLGVLEEQLVLAIYGGCEPATLEKIRDALSKNPVRKW